MMMLSNTMKSILRVVKRRGCLLHAFFLALNCCHFAFDQIFVVCERVHHIQIKIFLTKYQNTGFPRLKGVNTSASDVQHHLSGVCYIRECQLNKTRQSERNRERRGNEIYLQVPEGRILIVC